MNEQLTDSIATSADPAGLFTSIFAGGVVTLVVVALVVVLVASTWRVFSKAGQPGWAAIVPIYNIIVWLQIVQKPRWLVLLMFVPGVNALVGLWLTWELGTAFGRGAAFNLGLILLPIIFFPILAYGDAQYGHGAAPQPNGYSEGERAGGV